MYMNSLFFMILEHDMQNNCISTGLFRGFLVKICEFSRLFSIFTGVAFGRDGRVFLSLAGLIVACRNCQNLSKPILIGDLDGFGGLFIFMVDGLCPPRPL